MKLIIPAKHPNNKLWKFDVTLGCEAGTRIPALTACHVAKVPPPALWARNANLIKKTMNNDAVFEHHKN